MTSADYLIAQHVADLFRREPKNIGVFVRLDGQLRARFFGETEPSQIDGRKVRLLPSPSVYTQWVWYWRRTLIRRPETAWDEILKTARDHYLVINGGSVDVPGNDNIEDVLTFLYSSLVSEGGIASALGAPDEEEAVVRLSDAVERELKKSNLLMEANDLFGRIKHPVRRNIPVEGKSETHNVSFFQRNEHDVVMEPIDLGARREKAQMKWRAGWTSRVFEDIREKSRDAETIALISATAGEEKEENARYALNLVRPYATDVINWQSAEDRKRFLEARTKLAMAG